MRSVESSPIPQEWECSVLPPLTPYGDLSWQLLQTSEWSEEVPQPSIPFLSSGGSDYPIDPFLFHMHVMNWG
jgi:hypothetical protein